MSPLQHINYGVTLNIPQMSFMRQVWIRVSLSSLIVFSVANIYTLKVFKFNVANVRPANISFQKCLMILDYDAYHA